MVVLFCEKCVYVNRVKAIWDDTYDNRFQIEAYLSFLWEVCWFAKTVVSESHKQIVEHKKFLFKMK